ncbi:nuclear transport factor 2 family protein [Rhodococcus sp. NPDC019627]|uniref:nuclear transport factor 2 family protein n=1 Tax=unclassified Rhodococcus (in: high G+C Gram-positive bacteria) TaxID=192944 RepID=UPI0033E87CE5
MTTQKQQVVDLIASIASGAPEPVSIINADKYIQHNLAAADGLAGFRALLDVVPNGSSVNTVRVFQDGDFVVAQSEYNLFGPQVGFDIFRFEDGKIVEHWDNLQAVTEPNPSGRTLIDGPTEIVDVDKTEANKAVAEGFVRDVLVGGNLDKVDDYCDGDRYLQHHPLIADGVSNLKAAFQSWAEAGITAKYHHIHHVLGEGNFVLLASEGEFNGAPTAFYDLFRIENGKVAEHWDIVEPIPAREEWKNTNGKF